MKMSKCKRFAEIMLALLLAAIMAVTFVLPAFANPLTQVKETLDGNGDGKIKYVAIGADAAMGAGLGGGYKNAPAKSYPNLIAASLESSGKSVEFIQLGISGFRTDDLAYLLASGQLPDAYTQKEFITSGLFDTLGGEGALREEYIRAITDAEVITLDLGASSFLSYAFGYIFDLEYDADFTRFDDDMQDSIEVIKEMLRRVVNGEPASGSEKADELLDRVVDALTYAVVGYSVSFDCILEKIYGLNPDASVTVLNISNPADALDAFSEDFSKFDFDLPLSLIFGASADIANIYMAKLSEYAGRYNFAYAGGDGRAESFANDILNYTGTLTPALSEFLSAYCAKTPEELDTLVKLLEIGLGYSGFDIDAALMSDVNIYNIVDSIVEASGKPGFSLSANADYRALINDKALMTKLAIAAREGFGFITSLPNEKGHKQLADAFISAITSSQKGSDVLENNMNGMYKDLLENFDRDALENLENTLAPKYINSTKSYYVALGDNFTSGKNSYVTKIAEEFGLAKDKKYTNLAHYTRTPESLLEDLSKYKSQIEKADLITIGFNNARPLNDMFEQLKKSYFKRFERTEYDWASYLGEEGAAEIDKAFADIHAMLAAVFGSEARADMLAVAVEAYAYSYISNLISYPKLIEEINSITRGRALIVVVGSYNDVVGRTVILDGETIPIGNYIQYLIDIANAEMLLTAATTENVAYVDCPKVDTYLQKQSVDISSLKKINPYNLKDLLAFYTSLGDMTSIDSARPTEEGHALIAEKILEKITPIRSHNCEYDTVCDERCNICGAKRDIEGHKYDFACSDRCKNCGEENKSRDGHIYSAVCDQKCDVCEKERICAEHDYTGTCDTLCDLCGAVRQTNIAHTFGSWKESEGETYRTCMGCGSVEKYTASDVGDEEEIHPLAMLAATFVVVFALGASVFVIVWFVVKKKTGKELAHLVSYMIRRVVSSFKRHH